MELYTDDDMNKTAAELRKRIVLACLLLAVIIVGVVLFCGPLRNQTALLATMAVGNVILFYLIVVKVIPWLRYYLYQRDIKRGRSHEMDCRFVSISDQERISDGVAFRDFVVTLAPVDPDDEDERLAQQRLLLWDADKPEPKIEPGEWLHIRSFGNYITRCDVGQPAA